VSPRAVAAVSLAVAWLGAVSAPALDEEVKTVPTRPGVTNAFLLVRPPGPPMASVILFAGGHGGLALSGGGFGWGSKNFLVRTRARFAEHGLLVAVIDAPSDRRDHALWNFRLTAEHAEDVKAVIAALRALAPVPVWVVGTSMGTVSAASVAARLGAGGPDGVVLTSSVTRTSRAVGEIIGLAKLGRIAVPTLLVHHVHDECASTPVGAMSGVLKDLKNAPRKELLTFDGGDPPRSGPCEAMAAHGYLGLEAEVVAAIARWIAGAIKP
jgi:pimeloyl-ACP methyl ester carboxylesterase